MLRRKTGQRKSQTQKKTRRWCLSNKLGQYFESDDSNAVILISYRQRKVEAILDGGAGVSIMTKQCWEKWGSPHMKKTSLVVKLADGTTTRPVGVVKDLRVKTLGITYHV